MLWLDALLRIGSITLLFLGGILAVRDRLCWRPTIFIVLTALGVSASLITSAPDILRPPLAVLWPAYILEAVSIVFIWWFGLALFRDDFELKWPHWVVLIVTFALRLPHNIADLTGAYVYPPTLNLICEGMVIGMMAHLTYTVLREGRDDLVATRRVTRAYFIVALIVTVLFSTFAAQGWLPINPDYIYFVKSLVVFPMTLWFTLWLSRLDLKSLSFETETIPEPSVDLIDPRDKDLLEQLIKAMTEEKIYREPGLTIRGLAEHLGTPEHRLRSLINQGLGYRNFSAFLNSYRIDAVKEEFSNPEKLRIPVLTLAMDVGYNSLAPFNRAFRAIEGMTPTAYRQKLLQDLPPSTT